MPNANLVILIGNLTRDPELRFTAGNMAVCSFGLAVNRKYKDKEEVTFVDCTAWGKTAEVINQYVHKGEPLYVQGRLRTEQWDDKQSGAKRSKLSVVVESVQFLGGRRDAEPKREISPTRVPDGEHKALDDSAIPF